MSPRLLVGAVFAATGQHPRHGRLAILGLAVLVIAALAYGGVLLARRREDRASSARDREESVASDRDRQQAAPDSAQAPPFLRSRDGTGRSGGPAGPAARPAGPAAMPASLAARPAGETAVAPAALPPVPVAPSRWSAPNGWAVETHGLTKRFGPNVAVDDVELLVPRGCAFGYLGPNGAGKTTLIRTLLGLTRADAGSMSLLGLAVPKERSRALSRVGAIVDEPRFHGHLTGRENLRLLAAARGAGAAARIGPALERVGLGGRADDRVRSYSMGMRQRLGVAACLLGDPELLILDEPMNGLDPAGMHDMRSMIRSLVAEGRTVMLSSHLLDEVERTCDAVAIVDRGRVVRQGSIDELVGGAASGVVRVECSDPAESARLVEQAGLAGGISLDAGGLLVSLTPGSTRDAIADIVRLLVQGGISVYGVQETRASLEEWFLSVTSRLGQGA